MPDKDSFGLIPSLSLVLDGPDHVRAGQPAPISTPLSAGEATRGEGEAATRESTRRGQDPPLAIGAETHPPPQGPTVVGGAASGDHSDQLSTIGAVPEVGAVSLQFRQPVQPARPPQLPTSSTLGPSAPTARPGPLASAKDPIYVKIPLGGNGREKTISEILSYTFRENVVTMESGKNILQELSSVDVPIFIRNVVVGTGPEAVAYLKLPAGGTVAYSWTDQSTPQEWLSNLLTFAESDEQAADWIRSAVECWRALLGTIAPPGRQRRAAAYEVSDPARVWVGGDNAVSLIFVYCDIVQSALMSDGKARCVRVVPVEPKRSHYPLFPVHYFACGRKIVETIHIELRTRWNTYAEFINAKQPTVAVLHFRRIR